jgi:hypothetical protein
MQRKHECNMEDIWHNTKSANLWIMDVEEGAEAMTTYLIE